MSARAMVIVGVIFWIVAFGGNLLGASLGGEVDVVFAFIWANIVATLYFLAVIAWNVTR